MPLKKLFIKTILHFYTGVLSYIGGHYRVSDYYIAQYNIQLIMYRNTKN
jgi:hypothetical protein